MYGHGRPASPLERLHRGIARVLLVEENDDAVLAPLRCRRDAPHDLEQLVLLGVRVDLVQVLGDVLVHRELVCVTHVDLHGFVKKTST